MDRRLTSDELSEHFRTLYTTMARQGNRSLPIFSGDLSVALRLRHRVVKDVIETHFLELRETYGKRIQIVRYKRRGGCRAMRGYFLPLQGATQLLPYFSGGATSLLSVPEILHTCYTNEQWYRVALN
ncbi:MAG: hypothetical protein H0V70_03155 [Ktedonobacteraceae bacterium]|nr:hypothetical protein [Ktedonobacteraceae bacterium]